MVVGPAKIVNAINGLDELSVNPSPEEVINE